MCFVEKVLKGVIFYVILVITLGANVTENVRMGLTARESQLLSSMAEEGQTIFSLQDVMDRLNCPYKSAKVLVKNLAKKRWIILLSRGKYLIVPLSAGIRSQYTEHEFVIASHLVNPYYIGYWSALNHHGLTEQIPFTVFVVTTKRLKGRWLLNTEYKFITLVDKKFFGFEEVTVANHSVNISDREKTIVDCLDHPEYSGGMSEVAKSVWSAREDANFEKMVDYALRMGNKTILKRLGFLVDLLELALDHKIVERMRSNISEGFSPLDPTGKREGKHLTRWNLQVNVSEDSLLEWRKGF